MGNGKKPKTVVSKEKVDVKKTVINTENPDYYKTQNPIWSFKMFDKTGSDWPICKKNQDSIECIIEKLISYEGMTWAEIDKASGGRKAGNNSHFENVSKLAKEAQRRWRELNLEEYSEVYSLRLQGTHRLFGILHGNVFNVIWYDNNHRIYGMSS